MIPLLIQMRMINLNCLNLTSQPRAMNYARLMIVFAAVLVFASCSKNKFKTEPQVKAKSVKPATVFKGDVITFTASFTDDEGDIQDSVLIAYKRFNGDIVLTTDTLRLKLNPGQVPTTRQGEIIIKFGYGEFIDGTFFLNLESVDRPVAFGIIIRDNAGHRSNYAESERITLKKL